MLYVTLFLTSRLFKARLQRCFGTFSEMATVTSRPPLAAATRPSIQSVALRNRRSLASGRHPGRLCRPPATSDPIFCVMSIRDVAYLGVSLQELVLHFENYYSTRLTASFFYTTGPRSRADICRFICFTCEHRGNHGATD
jgi:hypothetical protein